MARLTEDDWSEMHAAVDDRVPGEPLEVDEELLARFAEAGYPFDEE